MIRKPCFFFERQGFLNYDERVKNTIMLIRSLWYRYICIFSGSGFVVGRKEICHFFQKKIVDNFGSFEKRTTFALAIGKMMNGCGNNAEIAQLVEHNLAKVRVASSSLVFRSKHKGLRRKKPRWRNGRRARFRCVCREACRFESCSGHHENNSFLFLFGGMAELVDAPLWGGGDSYVVWVRVSFPSPKMRK